MSAAKRQTKSGHIIGALAGCVMADGGEQREVRSVAEYGTNGLRTMRLGGTEDGTQTKEDKEVAGYRWTFMTIAIRRLGG